MSARALRLGKSNSRPSTLAEKSPSTRKLRIEWSCDQPFPPSASCSVSGKPIPPVRGTIQLAVPPPARLIPVYQKLTARFSPTVGQHLLDSNHRDPPIRRATASSDVTLLQ